MSTNPEAKIKEIAATFEKLQTDLNQAIRAKTLLDSQLQENQAVEKEFELLKDDNHIFKLIGPVLVTQEKDEAVTNIKKRIEYIQNESKRLEVQIKEFETKSEAKRAEIIKIQQQAMQQQQQQAKA